MSLAWMSRVWESERPRRSSHRLLLLALADNANDEGYCWPSVRTLCRKCATADRRTVLRQIDWLEAEGFVVREKRPGRSTVYHLQPGALGGGAAPTGGASPTGGGGPTGRGVASGPRVGDGAPPPPVAARPPEPTENPPLNPQQQNPPRSTNGRRNGVVPLRQGSAQALRAIVGSVLRQGSAQALRQGSAQALRQGSAHAAAVMKEEGGEDAVSVLVRRGVDRPVAEELASAHGAEAVERAVRLYDERRRGPKPPGGPGWLVAALRRGFAGASGSPSALLTHRQMLDWCEANGGLKRTAEFEPVRVEEGEVMFRRKAG